MEINIKQLLDAHYKGIFKQNIEKIKSVGVGDSFLMAPASDSRMSIALLIRIDETVSNYINSYRTESILLSPGKIFT